MKLKIILKNKILHYSMLSYFAILFCSFSASAQNVTIKGTVTDSADNTPLPGVTVVIKGSTRGASTDFDGNYSINAKIGQTLSFAYLGMKQKDVKITATTLNVSLDSDTESLDEIVVIGYGAVKKKELTGAVAQVKAEEITNFVTTDIASAIQGQVSGVNVTAASGEPGSEASIQIRGITSISGSNEPLWVVDGIAQNGNPGLSPNEIETLDILKDAASTSIYGAEGASGVILVTTKQGKSGKMSINVNTKNGFQFLGNTLPLMNTAETIFYEQTRVDNGASSNQVGPGINEWLNNDNNPLKDYVLVDNQEVEQHSFNFSGGTNNISYNAVLGYFGQKGSIINSNFERINARISSSYKSDNWKINGSISFTTQKQERTANNLIVSALRYKPYNPEVDPNSDVVFSDGSGPVRTPLDVLAQAVKRKNKINNDRINASIGITRQLSKELSIGSTAGVAISNNSGHQFSPKYTEIDISGLNAPLVDPTKSQVIMSTSKIVTLSADANITFKKSIGDHNIVLQGISAIKEVSRVSFDARAQGVSNNNIQNLHTTTVNHVASSGIRDVAGNLTGPDFSTKLVGFVGRVKYDFKGKYLLSASIRRDGYSAFLNNTWGNFPSISAAWNVSDEPFWEPLKSTVNNFKIRISRGTVGNNRFSDIYAASSLVAGESDYIFSEDDTSVDFGSAIRGFSNRNLKWETSISDNIGIDLAFLKNKITFTADYYRTRREDMLFPVRLPGSSGVYTNNTSLILNVGNMTNEGLELATKIRFRVKKSRFVISGTFSTNKNKITEIFGSDLIYNSDSNLVNGTQNVTTVLAKGYEVGAFWLYDTNGVVKTADQLTAYQQIVPGAKLGDLMYVDTSKNGTIGVEDRVYKGSALPDYELGLNLNYNYKNFDFSTNWYASIGSEILNGNRAAAYQFGRHKDLIYQWSADNPNSNVPLHRGENKNTVSFQPDTDYWLEDGSYLRLKQATLGFTLPKEVSEKINISKLRLFLNAQNPLTITKYTGYDPEIGGPVTRRGIDAARYPVSSTYTLGLQLKF